MSANITKVLEDAGVDVTDELQAKLALPIYEVVLDGAVTILDRLGAGLMAEDQVVAALIVARYIQQLEEGPTPTEAQALAGIKRIKAERLGVYLG